MSTYRLFPSTNGPSSVAAYNGPFIGAVQFSLTNTSFFDGFWFWVCPTGQSTASVKCCLHVITEPVGGGTNVYTVVPGSTVSSGTLTAGAWNFIGLTNPIPLSVGLIYQASVGFTSVGGFPDNAGQWSTGTYLNGIVNGPLNAYGVSSGTDPAPGALFSTNGFFTTAGTDPTTTSPPYSNNGDNFWVDVQIDDTPPANYSGSFRLWPTMTGADIDYNTQLDNAVDYVLATEIILSQACTVNKIWFYSPSGTAQLPTDVNIWKPISPGLSGTSVYHDSSPSWSGAAGSGWVSVNVAATTLSSGRWKFSVYNGATTPDAWSAKRLNYWGGTGAPASGGITVGPLFAPTAGTSTAASVSQSYGDPTPGQPGSGAIESGQSTFSQSPSAPGSGGDVYPNQYVGAHSPGGNIWQNYWVDAELTPSISTITAVPAYALGIGRAPTPSAGANLTVVPAYALGFANVPTVTAPVSVTGKPAMGLALAVPPAGIGQTQLVLATPAFALGFVPGTPAATVGPSGACYGTTSIVLTPPTPTMGYGPLQLTAGIDVVTQSDGAGGLVFATLEYGQIYLTACQMSDLTTFVLVQRLLNGEDFGTNWQNLLDRFVHMGWPTP